MKKVTIQTLKQLRDNSAPSMLLSYDQLLTLKGGGVDDDCDGEVDDGF